MKRYFIANLLTLGLLWLASGSEAQAICHRALNGKTADGSLFGVSNGNPVISTFDLFFSPFYSTSTTSGTAGCPNWDFMGELQQARQKFLAKQSGLLIQESAQGQGPHLEALALLMGCPAKHPEFGALLQRQSALWQKLLSTPASANEHLALSQLQQWIETNSELRSVCRPWG